MVSVKGSGGKGLDRHYMTKLGIFSPVGTCARVAACITGLINHGYSHIILTMHLKLGLNRKN